MPASTSYRLGEVSGYAEDPDNKIPPPHYREDLEPGELAWLMVEHPDETKPLWAEIHEVLGPGWYLGMTKGGEPVEFGAEHVFGIDGPRIQMGAWYDYLPGAKRKVERPAAAPQTPAAGPRPAAWWENLPGGPRSGKGPSIFDVWKRGAPAEPVPPPGAAPRAPQAPRKSFWDFLKPRQKFDVEPIPPAERRGTHSFLRLPGKTPPPPAPFETQVPQERPSEVPEAPRTREQAIIVPEAVHGFSVPENPPSGLPDELFQVLAPEGPHTPAPASGSMIVGPSSQLSAQVDAFSVLGPGPEPFGSQGLVRADEGPHTPAPFGGHNPFGMIVPGEPTPFDILEPGAGSPEQGLVVRPEQGMTSSSVFDILEPEPQPMTPYVEPSAAPPGPTLFDAVRPEPPKAAPKRKKTAKKRGPDWEVPTREEWVRWIKETFKPIENIWSYVRKERNSEYFLDEQLNEDYSGQPALVPIETWQDSWDFSQYLPFFGVPSEVWEPISEKMDEENEKVGFADEAWERMQVDVLEPLEDALVKAFKSIQPADLPGHFVLAADDGSGTWGLCYYEKLDPKTASKRQREALAARERDTREAKELVRRRKAEVKRIWGAMPQPEDLVGWIEEKFDLKAMFRDIEKARKSKTWRETIKEYGQNEFGLDVIANLGPNKAKDYEYEISAYFGIPPEIVSVYEDSDSGQELWEEIFWPFFKILSEAFAIILPWAGANLPGMISVDEDQEDHLILQYVETEEDEE